MTDLNTPVTNPNLIEAINAMRENNTPEAQNRMINEAVRARFIAPAIIDPAPPAPAADGKIELPKGTKINFYTLENNNGEKFFMAYTDWTELEKWAKDIKPNTLILTFDDFAGMLTREENGMNGFVINPFGENIVFSRELTQSIKEQKDKFMAQQNKEVKVTFGMPKDYPTELINAITDHISTQENISKAYFQLKTQENVTSYMLVLEFTGEEKEVYDKIAAVAKDHLDKLGLEITDVNSPFGKAVVEHVKPFYSKDARASLSDPIDTPSDLIIAMSKEMKSQKCISAAYLKEMKRNGRTSYLIAVELLEDNADYDKSALLEAAKPWLDEHGIEITDLSTELGKSAADFTSPFYKRKKFGLF